MGMDNLTYLLGEGASEDGVVLGIQVLRWFFRGPKGPGLAALL